MSDPTTPAESPFVRTMLELLAAVTREEVGTPARLAAEADMTAFLLGQRHSTRRVRDGRQLATGERE